MPDLLGANPCEGCAARVPFGCDPDAEDDDCVELRVYHAKIEYREALKAGGVKVEDGKHAYVLDGPGYLIFIPEAQP